MIVSGWLRWYRVFGSREKVEFAGFGWRSEEYPEQSLGHGSRRSTARGQDQQQTAGKHEVHPNQGTLWKRKASEG